MSDGSVLGLSDRLKAGQKALKFRKKKKVAGRRNLFVVLMFITLFNVAVFVSASIAYANDSGSGIAGELNSNTDQLGLIDMSDFEEAFKQLGTTQQELFAGKSLPEKVQLILSGDYGGGADSFLQAFLKLFFGEFLAGIPIIADAAVVVVLCGIVSQIKPSFLSSSTGEIVFCLFSSNNRNCTCGSHSSCGYNKRHGYVNENADEHRLPDIARTHCGHGGCF